MYKRITQSNGRATIHRGSSSDNSSAPLSSLFLPCYLPSMPPVLGSSLISHDLSASEIFICQAPLTTPHTPVLFFPRMKTVNPASFSLCLSLTRKQTQGLDTNIEYVHYTTLKSRGTGRAKAKNLKPRRQHRRGPEALRILRCPHHPCASLHGLRPHQICCRHRP